MNLSPNSWILTDGKEGMESQCLGLTEALGIETELRRIRTRVPWRWLPPNLWVSALHALGSNGDLLTPPWPDLLISTGRQTVAPALEIKRRHKDSLIAVQLQNPTVDPTLFDLVIAPQHDNLTAPNVLSTLGALHRVTEARLKHEAIKFEERYAPLPRPLVAVLVGGSNRQYRMTANCADRLGKLLALVARRQGAGIAITTSRRTGAGHVELLARSLSGFSIDIWDGDGPNPYFAMLALADAIVVTSDSVNMVSEAAATRRPVHIFELKGGSTKFDRFHHAFRDRGITRPFEGHIENWEYEAPDDMARAVEAVRRLL